MTNLVKLFKIETNNKNNYYFDSLDDANDFAKKNESIFRNISACYGEKHTQDETPYYYLAESTELLNKDMIGPCFKIKDHQYWIDSSLEKDKFHDVSDDCSSVYGDSIHYIAKKMPGDCYEERILLRTNEGVSLFDVNRIEKIYVNEHSQEPQVNRDAKFNEQLSIFKRQRASVFQEINEKKAKLVELDGRIQSIEGGYACANTKNESKRSRP